MSQQFFWGVSTSAYQIEGGHCIDGKGPSIWDEFCAKKSWRIKGRATGNESCDHYHRYREDVDIMASLNINAYRFSISWPRVLPEGKGRINEKGLDFYDRLVDALLEKNIEPIATLYHFDLPLELEKLGGWYNRDVAMWFSEYADILLARLSDRIKYWITVNEPMTILGLGYYVGTHAPGHINFIKGRDAVHHVMLAHGLAMQAIKSYSGLNGGISNILYPAYPHTPEDIEAVEAANRINALFIDPIMKGQYPDVWEFFIPSQKAVKTGDMSIISTPVDFLGLNIYTRAVVKKSLIPLGFLPVKPNYEGVKFTSMGWEIYPKSMYDALKWIADNYGNPEVLVTENGAAFEDKIIGERIVDKDRINYLKKYIQYMDKAIQEGINVKGYFVWSLLDNFEWGYGYTKKYGLVHVDMKTKKRTLKDSAIWYASFCRQRCLSHSLLNETDSEYAAAHSLKPGEVAVAVTGK